MAGLWRHTLGTGQRDDQLIFHAGTSLEEGERAALQFLNERADATAIQAVSDLVAMGAANILLNQGLRIPQEVSAFNVNMACAIYPEALRPHFPGYAHFYVASCGFHAVVFWAIERALRRLSGQ